MSWAKIREVFERLPTLSEQDRKSEVMFGITSPRGEAFDASETDECLALMLSLLDEGQWARVLELVYLTGHFLGNDPRLVQVQYRAELGRGDRRRAMGALSLAVVGLRVRREYESALELMRQCQRELGEFPPGLQAELRDWLEDGVLSPELEATVRQDAVEHFHMADLPGPRPTDPEAQWALCIQKLRDDRESAQIAVGWLEQVPQSLVRELGEALLQSTRRGRLLLSPEKWKPLEASLEQHGLRWEGARCRRCQSPLGDPGTANRFGRGNCFSCWDG